MRKTLSAIILLLSVGVVNLCTAQEINLIPFPHEYTPGNGHFIITPNTTITIPKGYFGNEAQLLAEMLKPNLGKSLSVISGKGTKGINLVYDASITPAEAYHLTITTNKITLSAGSAAGIFHGIETIRQLLSAEAETGKRYTTFPLPALTITDFPAYSWRGMHLDVSRHFFSIAYLKRFINIMALYKMNKLHLHLTDDQGWRIEIKKYPKLTENGAWRTFDKNDSACMRRARDNPDFAIDASHIKKVNGKLLYGGFYTQDEMRGLVKYAAERHIDIIPEIDMPGHMMAAINSYPYLTCNGENSWGELFTKPLCPCNETTFEFAENVFKEIMDIFPSEYIHIGGDEVDRSDWAKSDACKALMAREGIKDLPGLQSYFINRMEKFFNAHGRKMIGWDEIIEGGVTPSAYVMYWRTWVPQAPVKAAQNGNHVIMAPGEPLYFDNPQDQYSLDKIYHFNPVPKALNSEQAKLIIGAQAQLWSENIPSEKRADYMFMPRMTALSELLWTNDTADYASYQKRLVAQYKRMDALGINYRMPDIANIVNEQVFTQQDTLSLAPPLPGLIIRYTTDGTLPDNHSAVLNRLIVDHTMRVKVAALTPGGKRGDIYTINYQKQTPAAAEAPQQVQAGLNCNYYKAYFKETKFIEAAKPDSSFVGSVIAVPASVKAPSFAVTYNGYIKVPAEGVYTFYLTCDDGGVLWIADRKTVDNDGLHSAVEKNGQVALSGGLHKFKLDFIEGGGGFKLLLKYSKDGSTPQQVPASWFYH